MKQLKKWKKNPFFKKKTNRKLNILKSSNDLFHFIPHSLKDGISFSFFLEKRTKNGFNHFRTDLTCSTGCFFYFVLFDMPIIWSFFEQKLSSWTFFISTFRSYFAKKIWGKNFKNSKFYSSFCKSDDFKK
jgi:hypothetical protein